MKRSLAIFRYVICLSFAILAVSNCFNVLSSSTSSPVSNDVTARGVEKGRLDSTQKLFADAGGDRNSLNPGGPGMIARAGLVARGASLSLGAPFAPNITATKSHMLPPGDTQADPGDTLTYTVIVTNSGTTDATGVSFVDTIDPNTTLVPGSLIASPIANDDNYHTIGNVNISVSVGQGVIANDSNPNGSGTLTVTKVNATSIPGGGSATTSTANGSVTMSSDGSFTYNPNVAFRGPADSFTYTLDNGTGKVDTATVTIAVNGLIWFVDNTASPGGDGRLSTPFNCLVGPGCFDPVAADIANDNIFVYSGTYNGGLTLLAGQTLVGQGASQSLLVVTGLTAPSGNNLLPPTGGTNPTIISTSNGVNLGTNNQIWGVTFGNKTGAAISGTNFGLLTVRDTTIGGTGQALNLSTGTLDAIFQSISSTASSSTGMTVNNAAGSMSVTGATSVVNAAGAGVNLTNNTGTISFSNLNITSTTQPGLVATDNSNTITTTGGAISTGTGTAVRITRTVGTTPLNVTLTSVSASGGNNGIFLSGTSGSFTVSGDGTNTANGSGGTIQNMTSGADNTTNGIGVVLNNTLNITLKAMNLHDFSNFAINGTIVTGFTLDHCVIDGSNGTSAPLIEGSVRFNNLLGNALITGSTVGNTNTAGGATKVLHVSNTSGTLALLDIEDSTILNRNASSTGQDAIFFGSPSTAVGATMNLKINNCNLTASRQFLLQANFQGTTTSDLVITNSHFSNNNTNIVSGGGGCNLTGGGAGGDVYVHYLIDSNTFTQGNGVTPGPINVGRCMTIGHATGNGTFEGKFTNNTLGVSGITRSGAGDAADALGLFASGNNGTHGKSLSLIQNNTIQNYGETGIIVNARQGTAVLDVTIIGNIIRQPGSAAGGAFAGIWANCGALPGDTNVLNIQIGDAVNSANKNTLTDSDPNDFSDVFLENDSAAGTQFNLFKAGSASATVSGVIIDDNNGTLDLQPGFTSGTITLVAGSPMQPMSLTPALEITSAGPVSDSGVAREEGTNVVRVPRGENVPEEDVKKLTQPELTWIAQAAIARWVQSGISAEALLRLQSVAFEVADLPSGQLAQATSAGFKVDETAAGYGWFLDQSPSEDNEFDVPVPGKERQATEFSSAFGRVDLLTVVMRQLGAVYVRDKTRTPKSLRPLMENVLSPAVRRMPSFSFSDRSTSLRIAPEGQRISVISSASSQVINPFAVPTTAVFNARTDLTPRPYGRSVTRIDYAARARRVATAAPYSGETVTLNIGTIPAGESVTIMFSVTIDSPFPSGVCSVTNQGHITGSNFAPVDTNIDVVTLVAPVVIGACPANITTNADSGVCTATVTYSTPTATGCPAATVTCTPPSGFAFPKGSSTVTCTASNGVSPDSTCTFTVTVNDNQLPVITCPANVTQGTDPGQCSANVTYPNATATDNCSGVGTPVCTPPSGTTFAKGTTTVNCTVSDASGNPANCSFTVTVNDTQAPTISCPANVTKSTDPNVCTAVVTYSNATATDNCSGVGTPSCSPPSGTAFVKGVTIVNCTVNDSSGNPASCSFTVTVKDNQPPTMSPCPSNISVVSGGGCMVVNYTQPTATDNCGSATVTCSPPSGTCFAPGTTTVTCTASDTSPDSPDASCSFTVTVAPCTITCPANITRPNDAGVCGASVTFTPTSSAGCGTVNCSPSSGSFFPVGTTTVTCTTGAGPSCSFSVTVTDGEGPHITPTTAPIELWPANHKYHTINMSDLVASATDNCSGNLINNVVIASVSSDELENSGGDGNTLNDIVIAANCKSVQLRAERDGGSNGRVYTIVFKVKDAAGNVGTASRTVTVPHSQGGGPAVLGPGPGYTVNGTCP